MEVTRSDFVSAHHCNVRKYILRNLVCALLCASQIAFGIFTWSFHAKCFALCALCAYFEYKELEERRFKSRRLARFFSSFTHIDTLVLDNFRMSENSKRSHKAIGVVRKAVNGVQINRLEVRDVTLDTHVRYED